MMTTDVPQDRIQRTPVTPSTATMFHVLLLLCRPGQRRANSERNKSGARPKSAASRSTSSSSSSSGRGSLSPATYFCGPKRKMLISGLEGYVSPAGVLEEDDVDRESGSHNLLLDSSESSGESVSGLSCSAHSYRSALERETEDTSSVFTSTIAVRETASSIPTGACEASEQSQAAVVLQAKNVFCAKNSSVGKFTEV